MYQRMAGLGAAGAAVALVDPEGFLAAPVLDWLGRHVGPSLLTAEERLAPRRR